MVNSTVKSHVIIVAAGTGNRFGGDIPKQFAVLDGKPVIMRTIDLFRSAIPDAEILLVISPSEEARWKSMCIDYGYDSPTVVFGGATRTESVKNALARIPADDSLVLIHDGARPLLSRQTLLNIIEAASQAGVEAVIPCTPLTDSLMTNCPVDAKPVDRSKYVAVQTPQTFRASTLKAAYTAMPEGVALSDDAAVVEHFSNVQIKLVAGDVRNIKITYPLDLEIASLYLKEKN